MIRVSLKVGWSRRGFDRWEHDEVSRWIMEYAAPEIIEMELSVRKIVRNVSWN